MAVTVNNKNLGHATAYSYAKSKGYTGTEEEFAELMASYATVAESAAASAEAAAGSAEQSEAARDKSAQWATGETGGTPGATNNAEYYSGQASQKATDASGSAENAARDALKSEGFATGKQGGTDVGSDSPYYHANGEYYKEQAAGSATSAGQSAENAAADALKAEGYAQGKQGGTDVQEGSPYYHANGEYYKDQASGSATAAAGSATDAAADALKAEGYAVGKQGGTDVASGSPYYHKNGKYYLEQTEAVAQSIPEDYSELSSDVSSLKSAFSSYLIFSKAEMQNGAKTIPQNTNPISVSDNKFKCCDFDYVENITKHAYLYLENNTAKNMLAFVIARDASGVQIGSSGWYVAKNQDDLLDSVSSYLTNAKTISVTIAFSSTYSVGGIAVGIETFDYNIFALPYKVEDVDYVAANYLLSNAEIISPESQSVVTAPGSNWFSFRNVLKAGNTYIFVANTKTPSATASFAVANASTNKVTAVYPNVNNVTITPEVDSIVLFYNVRYAVGQDFRKVWNTTQTLSVDTVITFTSTPNTNLTFDFYNYIKLTPEYIYENLTGSGSSGVVIVGKSGNVDYNSINSAVNDTQDGDTILIMPGIYNEKVNMWGKNRHLVGVSKESVFIVSEDRYYGNEPLCANIGSVENITLIAGYGLEPIEGETQSGNYALHIEYANSQPYELVVRNCNIISNVFFAIGAGVKYNQTLKIIDCYLETKQREAYSSYTASFFNCGGLFFHNDASGSNLGTNGRIEVTNCEIKGAISSVAIQSQNNGNTLHARFVENLLWSTENGKTGALTIRTTPTEGHIAGSDIILDNMSFGNNVSQVNAD